MTRLARRAGWLCVLVVIQLLLMPLGAQKRQKDEELLLVTEPVRPLPEPPAVLTASVERLVFDVTPLSTQGLLSRQLDTLLKGILQKHQRGRVIQLRAFVVGGADSRRVQEAVAEVFDKRRLPLPVLTVVEVGPLPALGAQIILEVTAEAPRPVNPHGLAFISGQTVQASEPTLQVAPLVEESLQRIEAQLQLLGLTPADVLRLGCFCSSLQDARDIEQVLAKHFPRIPRIYLQLRRAITPGSVTCEAVARLAKPAGEALALLPAVSDGDSGQPAQVALLGPGKVAITGMQLGFHGEDSDVELALRRLGETLEQAKASFRTVAKLNFYALHPLLIEKLRKIGPAFYSAHRPPAMTLAEFEGLPSLDATFALDAVAAVMDPGQAAR